MVYIIRSSHGVILTQDNKELFYETLEEAEIKKEELLSFTTEQWTIINVNRETSAL
ncbi:hypothetical protein [Planococcus halocryophilus]|uniref:hypothetical protein n=1 Tax=Planococcus halocryophilus TaxID=1215089 RepID=UPI001F0EBE22|nr:hypothetical protein [Planococcus halocryophilus]MCH4827541.1 hypothetical protein [Planococcus halocryophilus]